MPRTRIYVVIPVIPEKLDANGLQIFSEQLSSPEQAYGDINRLAIACNRVEQNAEHCDVIEEIKSAYSLSVFETPKRTDLSRSIGECVSVFDFGKENRRVEGARDLFDKIADLFDETFEETAPEEVEAGGGWGDPSGIEGNYEDEEDDVADSSATSEVSETAKTSSIETTESTSTSGTKRAKRRPTLSTSGTDG